MDVAITGGTGFLGRYIVRHLADAGHTCRCWSRPQSDRGGFEGLQDRVTWIDGDLTNESSMRTLVEGTDAVVHAALDRPGAGFRGSEGEIATFVERNVIGTLRLIESARAANVGRFVFISTCAVHEQILDDRNLDEAHPLWPTSHYGAHKAAIEKFVHSYGLGEGYDICALRPTGIYGAARPIDRSKWYEIVRAVKAGLPVTSVKGGKEVHATDVAKAVSILLTADGIAGQAYNCFDMYIAQQDVARIAKEITNSDSDITDLNKGPVHQIDTSKLRKLGMTFGGKVQLEATIGEMLELMERE